MSKLIWWEYRVKNTQFESNTIENLLAEMGINGWELTAVVPETGRITLEQVPLSKEKQAGTIWTGYATLIFKRPKE